MSPRSSSLPPGTRINDRYVVLGSLGSGANGDVYRAQDENLDIEVALKLLQPVSVVPADWAEARVLEQLRGDFLLPVFNADVVSGSDIRYIATSVMAGGDLERAGDPHGVEVRQAVRWSSQLAHATDRIHMAGLLHRDVKPGNGYLDANGDAHLADLGMAVRIGPDGRTAPNGTPVTVAPEALLQPEGHCTISSDVYSLGATAFYLLAGDYPVSRHESKADCLAKVAAGNRRKLRDVAPHTPQSVANVIERAISTDPSKRQASALDFANQLVGARLPDRVWSRQHPCSGHLFCMKGVDAKKRKPISACVVPINSTRADLQVRHEGGNRVRRLEKAGFPISDLAKNVRQLCTST